MNKRGQVDYRLRLSRGFLEEAQQDSGLRRWRSAVDNAQLAVENAAKAVLALLGPVGKTHQPAVLLRDSIQGGAWSEQTQPRVERLVELAEILGPDVHIQTDYGDETEGLTPWELFDDTDARKALSIATETLQIATEIAGQHPS